MEGIGVAVPLSTGVLAARMAPPCASIAAGVGVMQHMEALALSSCRAVG